MKHFLDTVNEVFSALSWNLSAEQLNLGGNNTSTDTGKLKKLFFLDRRGISSRFHGEHGLGQMQHSIEELKREI